MCGRRNKLFQNKNGKKWLVDNKIKSYKKLEIKYITQFSSHEYKS